MAEQLSPTETAQGHSPQTDDELWAYVHDTWGVQIPRLAVCPGHVAPFTVFADAYFARHSVIVLKASRGLGGKSFLLAYLGLSQAHVLGADVVILGGSFKQSANVHRYMREAWEYPNAPRDQLLSDPTAEKTRLKNRAQIEAITASQRSARGLHPARAIQDECVSGWSRVETPSGAIPIRNINPGQAIYTFSHGKISIGMVSSIKCKGVKPTLRLRMSHGKSLCCTPEHPIRTPTGWCAAGTLRQGDVVCSMPGLREGTFAVQTPPYGLLCQVLINPSQSQGQLPMSGLRQAHPQSTRKAMSDMQYDCSETSPADLHELQTTAIQAYEEIDNRAMRDMPPPTERSRSQTVQKWVRAEASQSQKRLLYGMLEGRATGVSSSLSRLRSTDYPAFRAVSSMRHEETRCGQQPLRRLWHCLTSTWNGAVSKMLALLSLKNWWTSADDCRTSDGAEKPYHAQQSRTAMSCLARSFWSGMGRTSPDTSMDCRFSPQRWASGDRGSWGILARSARASRKGSTTAERIRRDGVHGYNSPARRDALLVENACGTLTIVTVEPGPTVDVWDVAVPETHAFIAEGVIVHNCDEMDLKIHEAAMGQAMPQRGVSACTVLSSTHQHSNGTFTAILKKAKDKGWPIAEYCYRETMEPHGWLAASTVAQKRHDMTTVQWNAEVEGQEPSPESRAIDPRAVAAMFRRDLGEYAGDNAEYLEIEAPVEGATYAHGADWAKTVDWTILVSLRTDVMPMRVVAFERMGRLAWPYMVGRYNQRILRYGGSASRSAHDATGLGGVIDGYLEVEAEGVLLVGRARADLLSNYVNAVEKGVIESPHIAWMAQEHEYASVNDLYGSGHLPDTICAMALAYKASGLTLPADVSEEEMRAIWQAEEEAEAATRHARRHAQAQGQPVPEPDDASPEAPAGRRRLGSGRLWGDRQRTLLRRGG